MKKKLIIGSIIVTCAMAIVLIIKHKLDEELDGLCIFDDEDMEESL